LTCPGTGALAKMINVLISLFPFDLWSHPKKDMPSGIRKQQNSLKIKAS
jgi:hypothetical protein